MKIKINETTAVDVRVIQTTVCPAGTAYYRVEYLKDGLCIHAASTKAMYGSPDVIAMLAQTYEINEYHSMDEPQEPGCHAGTVGGKPMWWITREVTHRQAIVDALAQIVEDTPHA